MDTNLILLSVFVTQPIAIVRQHYQHAHFDIRGICGFDGIELARRISTLYSVAISIDSRILWQN